MHLSTKLYTTNWHIAWGKDLKGRYISGQGRTAVEAILNALNS